MKTIKTIVIVAARIITTLIAYYFWIHSKEISESGNNLSAQIQAVLSLQNNTENIELKIFNETASRSKIWTNWINWNNIPGVTCKIIDTVSHKEFNIESMISIGSTWVVSIPTDELRNTGTCSSSTWTLSLVCISELNSENIAASNWVDYTIKPESYYFSWTKILVISSTWASDFRNLLSSNSCWWNFDMRTMWSNALRLLSWSIFVFHKNNPDSNEIIKLKETIVKSFTDKTVKDFSILNKEEIERFKNEKLSHNWTRLLTDCREEWKNCEYNFWDLNTINDEYQLNDFTYEIFKDEFLYNDLDYLIFIF